MTEKEDLVFLEKQKEKITSDQPFSQQEISQLVDKLEEMMEMNSVTVKIINRLMDNYNTLKQKTKNVLSDH